MNGFEEETTRHIFHELFKRSPDFVKEMCAIGTKDGFRTYHYYHPGAFFLSCLSQIPSSFTLFGYIVEGFPCLRAAHLVLDWAVDNSLFSVLFDAPFFWTFLEAVTQQVFFFRFTIFVYFFIVFFFF